jgi:fatty-acyl-CoA synthase
MRVAEDILIRCRPSAVWEVVGDPATYAEVMSGVTRWEAARATSTTGVGARYAMRMRVGSADVGGEVEVVEYQPCADLAWTGVTGIEQRGRWRIREEQPGLTRVTLRVAYQSPGGITGLLADRLAAGPVRRHARRTLADLRERLEGADGASASRGVAGPAGFVVQQLRAAAVFGGAGLLRPVRPDRVLAAALEVHRWGLSLPGGYAAAAAMHPRDVAIIDEAGELSFADVHRRSSALAVGLAGAGIGEGDRVAVLCRNHRGVIEATAALGKLGADALFLNTGFAGPQIAEVMRGEDVAALIHDEEFSDLVGGALPAKRRVLAWTDRARPAQPSLERMIAAAGTAEPAPAERTGRITILTSGTTGKPKGASRSQPRSADPAVAILSRIPLRAGEPTLIASPIFHSWGMAHLGFGVILSSTLVLQRRFDPEATLAAIERHRVTTLAAVPVMLQQILDLPPAVRRRHDTSSLRVVAVSGSALPGELSTRFMDAFGDILYNLYGSTEVAWATIATPEDLRAAPGTAGRPPYGTSVRLLDEHGREVADGETGRIFVANEMLFEGYTGGGSKDVVDGMMATGDLGRLDGEGRLFVEGREDDMLVSGGENVFPEEIEHVLLEHRDVDDVAIVGVPDERWGHRLHAFVVKRSGSRLTEDAVRDHVRSRLARYKVPRGVSFVDALPRNATGKVVRRELTVPDVPAAKNGTPAKPAKPVKRRASSKPVAAKTADPATPPARRGARRRASVTRGR